MLRIITNVIGLLRTSLLLDKKRAQGLSIQTIILVVLGLLILVALVAYLSARFTAFKSGVDTAAGAPLAT